MKKNYEQRIQSLLTQMTLEEKIGQLQQCGPSLVGAFDVSFDELLNMMFDGRITKEEFDRLMGTAERDRGLRHRQPPAEDRGGRNPSGHSPPVRL